MNKIINIIIIIIIIIIIPVFIYLLFKRNPNRNKEIYNEIFPSCARNIVEREGFSSDNTKVPIYSIYCIDFRYDYLTALFFKGIGLQDSYFTATAAGGGLSLGYNCSCNCSISNKECSEPNETMNLLRDSLIKNLEIALTLKPIKEIYILNHQDCGAIKAFLSCSGYPESLGSNNKKEIEINTCILINAKNFIIKKFPNKTIKFGIIDINGAVADYNESTNKWEKKFNGSGNNPKGLWYYL